MSQFVHDCHKEKIASKELIRMTGIIEAYTNKHGKVALTNQNEAQFDYGDQRITAKQRSAVMRGDRKAFWTLRKNVGDPIADIALVILHKQGIKGKAGIWLTGLKNDPVKLKQLGVDLMRAHTKAVRKDIEDCVGNVPGLLAPEQVADYHEDVFDKHGIGSWLLGSDGSWLFGGTLFNLPANLYRPFWCHACDFIGPSAGIREVRP